MRTLLLACVALLAAGCGAGGAGDSAPPTPPPAQPAPDPGATLYEATTTVLEAPGSGPMLCLGAVALSLPPQCGDISVAGWSWDAVRGLEEADGVRWGAFHVVGTYDGETFTLVEAGPARPDEPGLEDDRFEPPCPEPDGGWAITDPGAGSQSDVDRAQAYATGRPDYVASWVYHVEEPRDLEDGEYEESLPVVYVAVFTGDARLHETEIRARWTGPLCVVEQDVPSAREARRIRAEAEASLDGLGLRMLSSWEGRPGVAAEIQVVADPGGEGQAALDERFGPGLVRLLPALRPVG